MRFLLSVLAVTLGSIVASAVPRTGGYTTTISGLRDFQITDVEEARGKHGDSIKATGLVCFSVGCSNFNLTAVKSSPSVWEGLGFVTAVYQGPEGEYTCQLTILARLVERSSGLGLYADIKLPVWVPKTTQGKAGCPTENTEKSSWFSGEFAPTE